MKKDYEIEAIYDDGICMFTINCGLLDNPTCVIFDTDDIWIDFGSENINKGKKYLYDAILKPILGSRKANDVINLKQENVYMSYNKAKLFITNTLNIYDEDKLNLDENYEYRCIYDETLKTVSFYVKSNLYADEVIIRIYEDGFFEYEISSNNMQLTDLAKRKRQEMLKKFIFELLKVNINFGTVDGINTLKITTLYERAKEQVKFSDSEDTYTNNNSQKILLKGIGNI